MTSYSYNGRCGADIEEERHGDTTVFHCANGRGMSCQGSGYATELCDGCDIAERQSFYQNGGCHGDFEF